MKNIIDAGQTIPYNLLKSKFLYGYKKKLLKDLIAIVHNNKPNYDIKDIEKMFLELSECGCKYCAAANSIVYSIITSGISDDNLNYILDDGDNIDCHKVLVDIFSCLYGLAKMSFAEYEVELYDSIEDIYEKYGDAVKLTDEYKKILDGNDPETGKIRVKSLVPKINTEISTYEEIARKYLNIENKNITYDELKERFKKIGIEFNSSCYEPSLKVSGLLTNNFNFWINKYFEIKNINLELNATELNVDNFDYETFIGQLNLLKLQGVNTTISSTSNKEIWVHGDGKYSWNNLYNKYKGHAMTFKGISENGDIIVTSWGKDIYIPKEYWKEFEYLNISVYPKQKIKHDEESVQVK